MLTVPVMFQLQSSGDSNKPLDHPQHRPHMPPRGAVSSIHVFPQKHECVPQTHRQRWKLFLQTVPLYINIILRHKMIQTKRERREAFGAVFLSKTVISP